MKEIDLTKVDILFTPQQLSDRIAQLGKQISVDYQTRYPIVIGVLNGCQHFYSELTRAIDAPIMTDFIAVSSYGNGRESSGRLTILKDISLDVEGRDILLVEDIVDSGLTISMLKQLLLDRGAKSVEVASLLDKPSRRKFDITPKYIAFTIPDLFVFGYGLDYEGYYRNIPYVGVYKED